MKQYKLKDHVTDDMLVAVGFDTIHPNEIKYKYALRTYKKHQVIIRLGNNQEVYVKEFREIGFNDLGLAMVADVKTEIQDLIELGYVECVEDMKWHIW